MFFSGSSHHFRSIVKGSVYWDSDSTIQHCYFGTYLTEPFIVEVRGGKEVKGGGGGGGEEGERGRNAGEKLGERGRNAGEQLGKRKEAVWGQDMLREEEML